VKLINRSIALDSATKIAADMNVDNRIMHSIVPAAIKLGLCEGDDIEGILLSVKGKNIYFDRKV